MADLHLSNPSHHEILPESYIPTVSQRPRLTQVATGTNIPEVVDTNTDQIVQACPSYTVAGRQSAVEAKLMRIVFFSYTVAVTIWGLLMAAFPTYQNIHQPFSIPIYVGVIIAGLSQRALTLKPPETESWAKAMELLSLFSPGLLELGMIFTVAVIIVIYLS